MSYSVDLAYLDYFKNAASGMHERSLVEDRLIATGFASGTMLIGGVRTMGRVIELVIEIAKVVIYSLLSVCTLGAYNNFDRLKDHCVLLSLTLASFVAQPLQVIIHSLATIIGIVSPMAAYYTMQIGTTPLAWITSHENEIWQHYKTPELYTEGAEAITSKISSLFDGCSWVVRITVKTIIEEFSPALDTGLVTPLGYMDQFYAFGANPRTLTDEQKQLTPILLLNGNYSHQGTFLPLLHALKLSNNQRPVYTINLPPNTTSPDFIAPKIATIKEQYGKADEDGFEIDMVGHSMGSNLIQEFCRESQSQAAQIRRAITVGTPFYSKFLANRTAQPFDILGTKDCLSLKGSLLQEEGQLNVPTGHLGLLFHHESLNAMTQLLA